MNNACSGKSDQNYIQEIPNIFSITIKKFENLSLIADGHDGLIKQLSKILEFATPCKLDLLASIIDSDHNTSVIRFSGEANNFGKFITSAQLCFDEDGKIEEIHEVFHIFPSVQE